MRDRFLRLSLEYNVEIYGDTLYTNSWKRVYSIELRYIQDCDKMSKSPMFPCVHYALLPYPFLLSTIILGILEILTAMLDNRDRAGRTYEGGDLCTVTLPLVNSLYIIFHYL